MQTPYGKAAVRLSSYDEAKEEFLGFLNGIGINPTNDNVTFTGQIENIYGDMVTGIPFTYDYSAWNRLLKEKERELL